jgi:hypothetical protein
LGVWKSLESFARASINLRIFSSRFALWCRTKGLGFRV